MQNTHRKFIIAVLVLSLTATLIIYSLSREWELNLIAHLQQTWPGIKFFMQVISDTISVFSIGVPVVLGIIAMSKSNKHLREKALLVLLSIALAGIMSYGVKKLVREPRPYEVDRRIAQWSVGGGYGFPSGHTVEAVAAVASATLLWAEWPVAIAGFAWALLIMFSRIYLGVHDPGDVAAGTFIGTLSALIVVQIRQFMLKPRHSPTPP